MQSLGAKLSKSLGDHVTHYIVPQTLNESLSKRILAAELLGLSVVSPSWVKRCTEEKQKISETDFIVKGSLRVMSDSEVNLSSLQCLGEVGSEQWMSKLVSGGQILGGAGQQTDPLHHTTNPQPASTWTFPSNESMGNLPRAQSTGTIQSSATAGPTIFIPSFREIELPVITAEVMEKAQKRRRSERICDLIESDSDSDSDVFPSSSLAKRNKASEMESWDVISKISANQLIPVIHNPGKDGDMLEITPFAPSSSSGGSGLIVVGPKRGGGSGIHGLTMKGKKEGKGKGKDLEKDKSVKTKGKDRDREVPKINRETQKSNKTNKFANTVSAKPVRNSNPPVYTIGILDTPFLSLFFTPVLFYFILDELEDPPVPSYTKPVSKVVIAITGFDDHERDKIALLAALRKFIKTPKKEVLPIPRAVNTTTCAGADDNNGINHGNNDAVIEEKAQEYADRANAGAHAAEIEEPKQQQQQDEFKSSGEENMPVTSTLCSASAASGAGAAASTPAAPEPAPSKDSAESVDSHAMKRGRGRPPISAAEKAVRGTSTTKSTTSSTNNSSVKRSGINWEVAPTESSVSIILDPNDFSIASCTHIIVNSKSKTP